MPRKRKATSDALQILHRRYYEGKPARGAQLEEARGEDELARKIYELREEAGLTQERLAKLVGTTASVISRLENSDYEGRSLTMLKRIAAAVDKRVEIRFVSLNEKLQTALSCFVLRDSASRVCSIGFPRYVRHFPVALESPLAFRSAIDFSIQSIALWASPVKPEPFGMPFSVNTARKSGSAVSALSPAKAKPAAANDLNCGGLVLS
jgi:transcriptional regulator with XRE-family HTH domain